MHLDPLVKRGLVALSLTSLAVLGFASPALAAPVVKVQSASSVALTLPAVPHDIAATTVKKGIVLRWAKAAKAVDYELVVDSRFYMGLGTSKTLRLAAGSHTVQVRATNAAGASPWTKTQVFKTAPGKVSTSTSLIKG